MNKRAGMNRWLTTGVAMVLLVLAVGCDEPEAQRPQPKKKPKEKPLPTKRVLIGKNIYLERQGDVRRILISAEVCLRRGPLELLLTRTQTKEHEAILAADVEGRELKRALLAAGAKAGFPVKFEPKYQAATGQKIKVSVVYEENKKLKTVSAQEWIVNGKTKKPLAADWVFGGSQLVPNPLDPQKPIFLANEGDFICISNFESALLDLPVKVSKVNSVLDYECNTKLIPKMGTKVTVILEPVKEKK